jgi:hypothetical protein
MMASASKTAAAATTAARSFTHFSFVQYARWRVGVKKKKGSVTSSTSRLSFLKVLQE